MPKKKSKPGPPGRSRFISNKRPRPAKVRAKPARGMVYQLKITLDDIRPAIWRRVLTKDCTLAKLHDIIQAVMGWEDYHLHEFEIGDDRYGLPEQWPGDWGGPEVGNSRKIKLRDLAEQGVKKFRYQ